MQKKIFDKREKVFVVILSALISILCFVAYIINFVDITDAIKLIQDYIDLTNINYIKFISIFVLIMCMIMFLVSFVFLFIKDVGLKRSILLIIILFSGICFTTYYIMLFSVQGMDGTDLTIANLFLTSFVYINNVIIFTNVQSYFNFSLSNQIYVHDEKKDVNNEHSKKIIIRPKDTGSTGQVLSEEQIQENALVESIEKLRSQLRIKDLEKQYLDLKRKLDE